MKARIASVGACTAVGLTAEQTAFGIRAGLFCPRTVGHRDENGEELGAVLVASIPEEIVGWERLVSLALPALRETLAAGSPVPVRALYLALPAPRPGFDEMDVRAVCDEVKAAALTEDAVVFAVTGETDAFGRALALALQHLEREPSAHVLVGGVDSWHEPRTYEHMDAEFRLLSERSPNGFIPGEAAAFARLVREDDAGSPHAEVRFAEAGTEDPEGELDAVWTDLVERAGAALDAAPIPWVLVDQRTERHRGRSWDRVFYRLGDVIDPEVTVIDTLAERLGDVGAASGAVLLVHSAVGLLSGFAPGSAAVVALGSDGNGRASFALSLAANAATKRSR